MGKIIGLIVLAIFYLLAAGRYYPGEPLATLAATLGHLARSLPVAAATAYLVALVVHRVTGQWPAWPGLLRIFLIIALAFEFLYALHRHYA